MINKCYEVKNSFNNYKPVWRCNTFTSLHSSYDLKTDPIFIHLINQTESLVNEFAKECFGVTKQVVSCNNAWFNISNPGDFQEYHIHSGSHFSIVYYLKTPTDSGNFVVASTSNFTDTLQIPNDLTTIGNSTSFSIIPKENKIIIFRSNVNHMVNTNKSNDDRISVSMNFGY
jgi:uncharacterized protein (TIGR02466 family)